MSGYYEGEQHASARQYPSDTQRIVNDCFELPTRTETSQCVSQAYEASHENQRAEKDLKAQRDMSDWAWWVMVVGVLQFFATIITLGFVKLTLDATLEAVKDTGNATIAMQDANEIARDAKRAWIDISLSRIEWIEVGSDISVAQTEATYRNVGQGIATDIFIYSKLVILPAHLQYQGNFLQIACEEHPVFRNAPGAMDIMGSALLPGGEKVRNTEVHSGQNQSLFLPLPTGQVPNPDKLFRARLYVGCSYITNGVERRSEAEYYVRRHNDPAAPGDEVLLSATHRILESDIHFHKLDPTERYT